MRSVLLLSSVVVCMAGESGWQNLDRWLEITGRPFPAQSWVIEDGCLHAIANPNGMQDLRTLETYRSFDLRFEFKIAKGANSGVKYLVQRVDEWQRPAKSGYEARARGLEYQILDDATNEDAKNGPSRMTAALYSIYPPARRMPVEPEVWHRGRIAVDGDRVEHWLDGVKMLEFNLQQPEVATALRSLRTKDGKEPGLEVLHTTPISLQNHGGGVWFRRVQVRRLP